MLRYEHERGTSSIKVYLSADQPTYGEFMEVTLPISPLKPEESGHMLVVEGEGAAEEGVKNDSAGPDIHLGTRVQLARYYLGKERRDVPMAKKNK